MSKEIESGCVSGDCFNGKGKRVYENGYYEGEFKDGLFHGKGYLKFDVGFYNGDFQYGKKNGIGEELLTEKDKNSNIIKATFKNDEVQNYIEILDVTEDKNYEVILKLNNKLITDQLNQGDYQYEHSICDIYDAYEVVNLASCKIFKTNLNDDGDINFNTVNDMNEYFKICLFFNALFYIISEISIRFVVTAYELFQIKTSEIEHLTEKDQKKISNWLSDNYYNFFNSPTKFQKTINSMINSVSKKNEHYYKSRYNEEYDFYKKYDGRFAFENFSIVETKKDTSSNQINPNELDYKRNNEFTLKFSLINCNYPEEFRKLSSKSEKMIFKYK